MVEPVFEELAHAKTRGEGKIAFVKVDLGVGMGGAVAREYGVSATPTFEFFLDVKKVCDLVSLCISVKTLTSMGTPTGT